MAALSILIIMPIMLLFGCFYLLYMVALTTLTSPAIFVFLAAAVLAGVSSYLAARIPYRKFVKHEEVDVKHDAIAPIMCYVFSVVLNVIAIMYVWGLVVAAMFE